MVPEQYYVLRARINEAHQIRNHFSASVSRDSGYFLWGGWKPEDLGAAARRSMDPIPSEYLHAHFYDIQRITVQVAVGGQPHRRVPLAGYGCDCNVQFERVKSRLTAIGFIRSACCSSLSSGDT